MLLPTSVTLFASILAIGAACPVQPTPSAVQKPNTQPQATAAAAPASPAPASPAPASPAPPNANPNCDTAVSASVLQQIAPQSGSCASSLPECRTAAQAADPIAKSFAKYQICNKGEQAALIATMALESVSFQYSHNVSPGRPGQGTRNMMMPKFVLEYAASLPIADQAQKIGGASDQALTQVLKLLQDNPEYDFGSAAWYLSSQAGCQGARDAFAQKSPSAFQTYVTQCLETTTTQDRTDYYTRAVKAFGL